MIGIFLSIALIKLKTIKKEMKNNPSKLLFELLIVFCFITFWVSVSVDYYLLSIISAIVIFLLLVKRIIRLWSTDRKGALIMIILFIVVLLSLYRLVNLQSAVS
ncbi:MAG: hypothetical protein AB2392_21785 [Neobacillus sp.]|uniref:hypothetical protein n=1 Tax=Cytobacillus gottheilii TaxID=859144 RepID=UPI000833F27F|nr:hypothetical protein [Cytobacillus gottheilii]